jgi:hypothetical protein
MTAMKLTKDNEKERKKEDAKEKSSRDPVPSSRLVNLGTIGPQNFVCLLRCENQDLGPQFVTKSNNAVLKVTPFIPECHPILTHAVFYPFLSFPFRSSYHYSMASRCAQLSQNSTVQTVHIAFTARHPEFADWSGELKSRCNLSAPPRIPPTITFRLDWLCGCCDWTRDRVPWGIEHINAWHGTRLRVFGLGVDRLAGSCDRLSEFSGGEMRIVGFEFPNRAI